MTARDVTGPYFECTCIVYSSACAVCIISNQSIIWDLDSVTLDIIGVVRSEVCDET